MSELISRNPKTQSLLFTEELYQIKSVKNEVAVNHPEPKSSRAPVFNFDYLGENNRFFLLLVDEPQQQYLDSVHCEALSKILQAKGLELTDVAIWNLQHAPDMDFGRLKDFFSCSKICLFGIDPQRLQLPAFPTNEPTAHEDVKVLTTFGLQELLQTQHKKVAFWNAMKDF
jgi:hypothetical protein